MPEAHHPATGTALQVCQLLIRNIRLSCCFDCILNQVLSLCVVNSYPPPHGQGPLPPPGPGGPMQGPPMRGGPRKLL